MVVLAIMHRVFLRLVAGLVRPMICVFGRQSSLYGPKRYYGYCALARCQNEVEGPQAVTTVHTTSFFHLATAAATSSGIAACLLLKPQVAHFC